MMNADPEKKIKKIFTPNKKNGIAVQPKKPR